MMKKTLILSLVLFSVLICSTSAVSADNYEKLKDYEGDEIDYLDVSGEPESRPNVDILLLEYEQNGKTVTVTLHVKGVIQNRGSMADYDNLLTEELTDSLSLDAVVYEIALVTSSYDYTLTYINKEVNIVLDDDYSVEIPVKSFNTDKSELTITFDLLESGETFEYMGAAAQDVIVVYPAGHYFVDMAPDLDLELDVTIDGPSKSYKRKNNDFEGKVANSESSEFEWFWDFGDENTSTEENPTHKYAKPGNYTVTLEVIDEYYTIGQDSYVLKVTEFKEDSDDDIVEEPDQQSFPTVFVFLALIVILVVAGLAAMVHMLRK